jgi:hypothetical protein
MDCSQEKEAFVSTEENGRVAGSGVKLGKSAHPVQDCRRLAESLVETASLNSLHRRVKTGFRDPLPFR